MIKIEVEGLKEGAELIASAVLDYALTFMQDGAIRDAPYRDGGLVNGIHKKKTSATTGEVESAAWYSGYLEYGTQAHIIVPVSKKALHWENSSGEHFAKIVHNPGIHVGTPESPRVLGNGKTLPFLRPQIYRFMAHASSLTAEEWKDKLNLK
jgi:hypothetical protein